ncbi:TniQ family protein [Streptomyces sp. NPDC056987]|uniref:TniQ family protein n=1 Tax=Streptomyces sp. NPDC056987 TaxID=3345988 RepID=UPI00362E4329
MEPWEAPVRLLPLPLPPVHGEVFGWYLHRLAAANQVTAGQLAKTLTPFKNAQVGKRTDTLWRWTPMVLPRLAALTGLTPETLRMLLPAIARVEARTAGDVVRYRRRLYVACSHCMHRRGITRPVLAHRPADLQLCRRHGIWVDGNRHYRVGHLPELVSAEHRHRRIARRFPDTLEAATKEAQHLVCSWLHNKNQPHLLSRWNDRLAQLPPKEAIYGNIIRRRVDERDYIATYPEFVTLLGMLADPAWRTLRAPRRWANLSQHRRTINAVYAEAEHRLNVPTLREKLHSHTFSNDALFRWTDPLGRSLMLVMTPDDHDALRDELQQK